MNNEDLPVYTKRHWAKFDRESRRIHLLEHHLADVGACFEALLAQPNIRRCLARSGGLDDLDETACARLSLFAALHDIGKANVGFQTRVWQEADFPEGRRKPGPASHYNELVPVLVGSDSETAKWFFDALAWWDDATVTWDDRGGETVCALFVAALSHHGLPLKLEGGPSSNPSIWRPLGELSPQECVQSIGRLARAWFPAAFSAGAPPLPSAPAFQHMFLGLCTLADWIGSDETYFKYCDEPRDDYIDTSRAAARRAVSEIGLDIEDQPRSLEALPDFGGLFPHIGQPPNAIQKAAAEGEPLDEQLVIIESETGSGKTEAALWRFARMYAAGLVDGIYFALPTRAAATQLHERVNRFIKRLLPADDAPEAALAIPGYVRYGDITGSRLQDYAVWWDDHAEGAAVQRRWAAESSKRYLAAQIAVGTVDQAMMAALKVRHSHMRAACLARNLLVVDEVHASDTYMGRILRSLLEAHLDAGGYALLMSATLGYSARRLWLSTGRAPQTPDNLSLKEAIDSPYPAISATTHTGERVTAVDWNGREKTVSVFSEPLMHNFDAVATLALGAARNGAKVLVIRNTVGYAIGTQQAVEEGTETGESGLLFDVNGIATLHHGRFATEDRRLLDRRVEVLLGKERPGGGRVVVGTQTLEQSLDIDADLLITDLCPVDVLLQRIGRLHRHPRHNRPEENKTPACAVLTPEGEDLSPLLARVANANGLGPHGFVYADLRVLEATRRLIAQHGEWSIPKMNRELVERATHPEALERIVLELGDEWRVHANSLEGGQIADGLTARNAIVRRDKSFFTDNREVIFGDMEERIRARLGDDRLALIHRRTACRRPAEETKGCASESGIMVLKQKTGPRKGAPDRCYHATNPTASKSPSTTTAWCPMPG